MRDEGPPPPAADLPPVHELFERHLPDLTRYVRRRTDALVASRESSRDLVQSVCREVIEHGARFRHGGEEDFRRWLFRTAERKIIGRYRYYTAERRAASREHPLEEGPARAAPGTTPSQDAIGREQLRWLSALAILGFLAPALVVAEIFRTNQSGILFQTDLGEDTAEDPAAVTECDPGRRWDPVKK